MKYKEWLYTYPDDFSIHCFALFCSVSYYGIRRMDWSSIEKWDKTLSVFLNGNHIIQWCYIIVLGFSSYAVWLRCFPLYCTTANEELAWQSISALNGVISTVYKNVLLLFFNNLWPITGEFVEHINSFIIPMDWDWFIVWLYTLLIPKLGYGFCDWRWIVGLMYLL